MKILFNINKVILYISFFWFIMNVSNYIASIIMLNFSLILLFLLVLFAMFNLLFYCRIKKQIKYPSLLLILNTISIYLYLCITGVIGNQLTPYEMVIERENQRFDSIAKYHPEMLIWRDSLLNVQAVLKKQLDSLEKQEYILLADTIQKKTIKGRKKIVECKEKQVQLKHSIEDINRYFREKL